GEWARQYRSGSGPAERFVGARLSRNGVARWRTWPGLGSKTGEPRAVAGLRGEHVEGKGGDQSERWATRGCPHWDRVTACRGGSGCRCRQPDISPGLLV